TGLHSDVRGPYREAIEAMNQSASPTFAVDIPSGLNADTGQAMGCAVVADATTTFIAMKLGLLTGAGRHHAGQLYFDSLDVPQSALESQIPCARRLNLERLVSQIAPRRADSHKGSFGHILLIGGDHGFGGAIQLAALAASRMGPGLLSVATQLEHVNPLLACQPEVMAHAVRNIHDLGPLIEKATHIVVGPGLGQSAWSQQMLTAALQSKLPCVLDADALNLIAEERVSHEVNGSSILTPHPGEAARLLGTTTAAIQSNRLESVLALQKKYGGSVLLKGNGSLIAHASGHVRLCSDGNPGMASGGMGDVLSGMIGGLLAQGLGHELSLDLAVALHARAADEQACSHGQRGLLASDLIAPARRLLNAL
ncbi:MAG: NAD(P)H-hydrate dehydratase, partial [Oleiphilaceae bacterium]|nr:NAD(P)H-hydrate dehydratase [Oleiphilaceae bacterium]